MVVGHHHATSLTLAQPNFHYPIPTSFELTQRGPTDWVCGATNKFSRRRGSNEPSLANGRCGEASDVIWGGVRSAPLPSRRGAFFLRVVIFESGGNLF